MDQFLTSFASFEHGETRLHRDTVEDSISLDKFGQIMTCSDTIGLFLTGLSKSGKFELVWSIFESQLFDINL